MRFDLGQVLAQDFGKLLLGGVRGLFARDFAAVIPARFAQFQLPIDHKLPAKRREGAGRNAGMALQPVTMHSYSPVVRFIARKILCSLARKGTCELLRWVVKSDILLIRRRKTRFLYFSCDLSGADYSAPPGRLSS